MKRRRPKKALRYVLLTKPERIGKTYNAKLPICAEVEQDKANLFLKMADQAGFEAKNRPGIKTSRGNLLFDLHNEKCIQADAEDVETWPGVVGTSSFFDLCTDVIYEEKGKTIHLRKEELK
ncbi:MAG: ribose-5-phosphate isomerase A [Ligilactobacillus ruminis]|nr:ribose-5-phosphate isomerase A [Ligilactobacillus ruminis]